MEMDASSDSGDSSSSGSECDEIWEGEGVAHSLFDDFTSPFASHVYKHMASKYNFEHCVLGKGTLHRIALITYLERQKAKGSDVLECYRKVKENPSIILDKLEEYINPPFENEKLLWDFMESSDEEGDDSILQGHVHQEQRTKTEQIAERSSRKDEDYFNSYKRMGIHREMILDKVRTGAYEAFIKLNSHLFKDKVVLDVGCGSGILSLFAASAGAKLVVGIDNCENMVTMAQEHAHINRLANTAFFHSKIEDCELVYIDGKVSLKPSNDPGQTFEPFQCDILISEWMGYGLLYENMFPSVIYARDKYLKETGFMVPSKAKLGLFGLNMYENLVNTLKQWEEPLYGFLLSGLKYEGVEFLKEPLVEVADRSRIVSDASGICLIDLKTVTTSDLSISQNFEIKLHDGKKCSTLALYFDCIFEPPTEKPSTYPAVIGLSSTVLGGLHTYKDALPSMDRSKTYCISPNYDCHPHPDGVVVIMSTRPDQTPTHWKQVLLHLMDYKTAPVQLEGDIRGTISLHQNATNPRWLDILIHMNHGSALVDSYYKVM